MLEKVCVCVSKCTHAGRRAHERVSIHRDIHICTYVNMSHRCFNMCICYTYLDREIKKVMKIHR